MFFRNVFEWYSTIHFWEKFHFLWNFLNLIGCHGNQKAKFGKHIQKINSSEAIWGIKLKLAEMFIELASTKIVLLLLHVNFGWYGKNEDWI